jgi:hypothetical protein
MGIHLLRPTRSTNQPITLCAILPKQDYGGTKPQSGFCKLRKTSTTLFPVPFLSPALPFAFPLCQPLVILTGNPFLLSSLRTSLNPNQPLIDRYFYPGVASIVLCSFF